MLRILAALSIVLPMAPALAQPAVVVNDRPLTATELRRLESVTCRTIPPGRYWFSLFSGMWGIEGDPTPRGHYRACCSGPCEPVMAQAGR